MHEDSPELFAYRLEQVELRVTALATRLENDYVDKHGLQAEYLSRMENERLLEKLSSKRNSVLLVGGGIVVALCAVGSFILSVVQVVVHG